MQGQFAFGATHRGDYSERIGGRGITPVVLDNQSGPYTLLFGASTRRPVHIPNLTAPGTLGHQWWEYGLTCFIFLGAGRRWRLSLTTHATTLHFTQRLYLLVRH